ncbi:FAD binding domain-containing protein [Mycena vulgaris]|nr:FAD binding domain-containing protein [Mycena vulgaris]
MDTDVLIIGAGPAGLMAALVLSRMKVKVRVLDRRLAHEVSGQADGIQPRMLEIWESLGLGSELRARSEHVYRMVTYEPSEDGSGIKARFVMANITVPSARYQYEILARIDIIEQILEEQLRKEGITVERPAIPVSLTIGDGDTFPIKVKVAWLNEQIIRDSNLSQEARGDPAAFDHLAERYETISTKFVIGCDGGKSWTRKQLNIPMEGNQTNLDWGVIDFTPRTNFPTPRAKNIIQSPLAGALGYLPRPNGSARVYVMLGEGQKETVLAGPEAKAIIADTLYRGFAPYKMEIEDATWCTIFRVSQRVAQKFSGHGRIFIAGDACHTHSPKAGQGANASMSDTFNLAWKIGSVVHQRAKLEVLDTYEEERRPHSIQLIELDRKIFRLFAGQTVSPEEYTNLWEEQIMFASGIGQSYLSQFTDLSGQSLAPGLAIGKRLPSLEVIRVDDWRPVNLHDISPFDGKFRLFVLPGNMLDPSNVGRLAAFSRTYLARIDRFAALREVLEPHIILDNDVGIVVESIPLPLELVGGGHNRINFGGVKANTFRLYNNWDVSPEGIAVVVRPDNHICAITTLDDEGVNAIEDYFTSWIQST